MSSEIQLPITNIFYDEPFKCGNQFHFANPRKKNFVVDVKRFGLRCSPHYLRCMCLQWATPTCKRICLPIQSLGDLLQASNSLQRIVLIERALWLSILVYLGVPNIPCLNYVCKSCTGSKK